jgi:hypothetical protein
MALPFDPSSGAYIPGSGVLAQPTTITNPLDPQNAQATLAAMAQARAKDTALKQQLLRAQVLKAQTEPDAVKGGGPSGIRIGQGPMGWAVSLGDLAAAYVRKKALQKGGEGVIQATGELSPAEQEYVNQYLNSDPSMPQAAPRYGKPATAYIAQGSPLSLSNQ